MDDIRITHNGYLVVPAALRNAQKTYTIIAENWTGLREDMLGWQLDAMDLGLLGRLSGVVQVYNQAVSDIAEKVRIGAESMTTAGQILNDVATAYEAQDEKYYAAFGWIDNQTEGVAPPPKGK